MEIKLQELKINYDKFVLDLEMHYNIILGFVRGSQLATSFPSVLVALVKEYFIGEDMVQQIALDFDEHTKNQEDHGQVKEEQQMEKAHSGYNLCSQFPHICSLLVFFDEGNM